MCIGQRRTVVDLAKRIKSGANLCGGGTAGNSHYRKPRATVARSTS
jgi:hypothetical protein